MHINVSFLLAVAAIVCAVLMLLGKRFSKYPLAAVGLICLAINQLGLFH